MPRQLSLKNSIVSSSPPAVASGTYSIISSSSPQIFPSMYPVLGTSIAGNFFWVCFCILCFAATMRADDLFGPGATVFLDGLDKGAERLAEDGLRLAKDGSTALLCDSRFFLSRQSWHALQLCPSQLHMDPAVSKRQYRALHSEAPGRSFRQPG